MSLIEIDTVESILYRENSIIDADDVPLLMEVIKKKAVEKQKADGGARGEKRPREDPSVDNSGAVGDVLTLWSKLSDAEKRKVQRNLVKNNELDYFGGSEQLEEDEEEDEEEEDEREPMSLYLARQSLKYLP